MPGNDKEKKVDAAKKAKATKETNNKLKKDAVFEKEEALQLKEKAITDRGALRSKIEKVTTTISYIGSNTYADEENSQQFLRKKRGRKDIKKNKIDISKLKEDLGTLDGQILDVTARLNWGYSNRHSGNSGDRYTPITNVICNAPEKYIKNRNEVLSGEITYTPGIIFSDLKKGKTPVEVVLSTGCPDGILKQLNLNNLKMTQGINTSILSVPNCELEQYKKEWGTVLTANKINLIGWETESKASGFGISRLAAQKLAEYYSPPNVDYTIQIDQNVAIGTGTPDLNNTKIQSFGHSSGKLIGQGKENDNNPIVKLNAEHPFSVKIAITKSEEELLKKEMSTARPTEQYVQVPLAKHYLRCLVAGKEDISLGNIYGAEKSDGVLLKLMYKNTQPISKEYNQQLNTTKDTIANKEKDYKINLILPEPIQEFLNSKKDKKKFLNKFKKSFSEEFNKELPKADLSQGMKLKMDDASKLVMTLDTLYQKYTTPEKTKNSKGNSGTKKVITLDTLDNKNIEEIENIIIEKQSHIITLMGDCAIASALVNKVKMEEAKEMKGSSVGSGLTINDLYYNLENIKPYMTADFIDLTNNESNLTDKLSSPLSILAVDNEAGEAHAVCAVMRKNDKGGNDIVLIDPLGSHSPFKSTLESIKVSINSDSRNNVDVIYANLQEKDSAVCTDISLILIKQLAESALNGKNNDKTDCLEQVELLKKEMYPHKIPADPNKGSFVERYASTDSNKEKGSFVERYASTDSNKEKGSFVER